MNITPWPTNTSSSIVTPSQMKLCDEILQRAPMTAFFWISTKAPIFVSSPIAAAVEIDQVGMEDHDAFAEDDAGCNGHYW